MTRSEMKVAAETELSHCPVHPLRDVAHRLIYPPNYCTTTKGMLTAARQIMEFIRS